MWLLNVATLELEEFLGLDIPAYGILSHTWGSEEVTFQEMRKLKHRALAQRKAGFHKIEGCREQARKDGLAYVWVDSCCIDKRSSAELSEAINCMFKWYKQAACCYVYLADVAIGCGLSQMFERSAWFSRGWTLQELLAPREIIFFTQDWTAIGYKSAVAGGKSKYACSDTAMNTNSRSCRDLSQDISRITDIPKDFLDGTKLIRQACLAQRMYWAAWRKTTRPEDRAYSLMGIFDINMPILYGEGLEKAFTRLQSEVISRSPDQSIFAWYETSHSSHRLLADSPDCFRNSGKVIQMDRDRSLRLDTWTNWSAFSITNLGLQITLPLSSAKSGGQLQWGDSAKAALYCSIDEPGIGRRRIFLDLVFLNSDISGQPIFMCHRARRWIVGLQAGYPTRIFLSSNDYISALSEQKIAQQPEPEIPESLVSRCMKIIEDEVGLTLQEMSEDATFADIGCDSLMILTIRARMREELSFDIGNDAFLQQSTVIAFRNSLISREGTEH